MATCGTLVQRLVEAAALAAQFEVGHAVDGAHRRAELAQRGLVDEVHRERQCHAERDRQQRGQVAPRVVAQLGPRQLAQQARQEPRQAR